MKELAKIVELKSKAAPASYTTEDLRRRLGYDTAEMRRGGGDSSSVEQREQFNAWLEPVLAHPIIGAYLRDLTPQESYQASGVTVLGLVGIREEIRNLAPGAHLLRYGYLVFASGGGGDALCFHAPSGRIVWADHEMVADEVYYRDPATRQYKGYPVTAENLELCLPTLSRDIPAFLDDLLHDRLTDQLDALD